MKNVLVVEDNPDNRRLIEYALKRKGYAVVSAVTGEACLEIAVQEKPDFILMDIQLPGINGYEAAKLLKANPETTSIPVIALTSFAMKGDRAKAVESGCIGYFEKPFDPLTIIDQIETILGGR